MDFAGIVFVRGMLVCLFGIAIGPDAFAQEIVQLDQRTLSGLGLEGGPTEVDGQVRYGKTLFYRELIAVAAD